MEILGMGLLQLLNWPLKLVYFFIIRPLGRAVTSNPYWPDEPGQRSGTPHDYGTRR